MAGAAAAVDEVMEIEVGEELTTMQIVADHHITLPPVIIIHLEAMDIQAPQRPTCLRRRTLNRKPTSNTLKIHQPTSLLKTSPNLQARHPIHLILDTIILPTLHLLPILTQPLRLILR